MSAPAARLLLLADVVDEDGRPRVGLLLPRQENGHQPPMVIFPSIGAALQAKAAIEAAQ